MYNNQELDYGQSRAIAPNKVLTQTYALLGVSMIPTVIGAFIGKSMNWGFMAGSPFISLILMLGVSFAFFWGIAKNRNSGLGVALLLGFTFFMGLMLGPLLQAALSLKNGATLIGISAGGTGLIFLAMATLATTIKRSLNFLGNFLFVGLMIVVVASLANMFFQIPALQLAISAVCIMIFSLYILYDVNQIVTGGETNYIMATLSVYLDIYNLFANLLSFLMALFGERD